MQLGLGGPVDIFLDSFVGRSGSIGGGLVCYTGDGGGQRVAIRVGRGREGVLASYKQVSGVGLWSKSAQKKFVGTWSEGGERGSSGGSKTQHD